MFLLGLQFALNTNETEQIFRRQMSSEIEVCITTADSGLWLHVMFSLELIMDLKKNIYASGNKVKISTVSLCLAE